MIKFILVSLIVWFIILKVLRFKFVLYKGPGFNQFNQHKSSYSNATLNNNPKPDSKRFDKGEYVDFEEVK